jgi:hypothetical protein
VCCILCSSRQVITCCKVDESVCIPSKKQALNRCIVSVPLNFDRLASCEIAVLLPWRSPSFFINVHHKTTGAELSVLVRMIVERLLAVATAIVNGMISLLFCSSCFRLAVCSRFYFAKQE